MSSIPARSFENEAIPGLEEDEVATRVVREELKLLATVQDALGSGASANMSALRGRELDDARLLELREDVAVAKPEDLPALFEQMHHLGSLRAQRGKGVAGSVDAKNPYFGHLRLEEGGKRRDILIGAKSYVDSSSGIKIVDWRQAPVSRIYYRYREGDDYEETLGGRPVEGMVLARRGVAISDGKLVRVSSPQGTFVCGDDGRWKRLDAFSARLRTERPAKSDPAQADGKSQRHAPGDKHLPAIASMLDAAQFELITRPGAGLIAIQGSAGSGKTTVGLHRIAYLAFADPQRFRADRMMVVVPHEALMHFVARVLPSLGVEGVPISTFPRFARRLLPELFPKLPHHYHDDTPPVVLRAKNHPAMLRAIHTYVERLHEELDQRVERTMEKWPSGHNVVTAWKATRWTGAPASSSSGDARGGRDEVVPDQRVTTFAQWLAGKRALDGAGNASTLPAVTRGAIERLGQELRTRARAVMAAWDEILTSRELLTETFRGSKDFGSAQLDRVHEWCVRQARVRAEGERDGETASIDHEDVPILLRLWQVMRGPLSGPDGSPIRMAHLFIDEVQDHSPLELRVLLDLATKDRSITLAGDSAQRMLDDDDTRGEFDWKGLLAELGMAATTLEPLKVSYRSTAEITTFARGVLGPYAHEAEPITTRRGPPVELFTFASVGESVAFLADALKQLAQDEPYANVALVARFPQQADVIYEGLERAEVPRVRRVAKQDFSWEPGFDVTDVRQTKGLEFDEVILLETTATSYPETSQARHALYVGATRAAHQLWCIASDKPSPVVTAALETAPAELAVDGGLGNSGAASNGAG
ncbi:3'-5' exonuclease [Pendulispora albinea]|uniref:ATP-binding domain-containing protein n=1 Tax=Pendulispora albinea TaxID=2741071 RepID=A0ABZ2MAH3_9BACT